MYTKKRIYGSVKRVVFSLHFAVLLFMHLGIIFHNIIKDWLSTFYFSYKYN